MTGLPPTYEEYLRHRSRSHTPPPPWSDSITTSSLASSSSSASNSASRMQVRRELLASQPELREYFAQLTLAQSGDRGSHYQHQQQQQSREISTCSSNQQALREQQVRVQQRARAMPPRSQSASRAQQQRIAKMYEDAAFCMETTVLQSAFDQGFGLCNLM